MKKHEAEEFLKNLELSVIKARSNVMETLGIENPDEYSPAMTIAIELNPWLFGIKGVLPALSALNKRIAEGEKRVGGQDVMNFIQIANQEPMIGGAYESRTGKRLPKFDVKNVIFWDDENTEEIANGEYRIATMAGIHTGLPAKDYDARMERSVVVKRANERLTESLNKIDAAIKRAAALLETQEKAVFALLDCFEVDELDVKEKGQAPYEDQLRMGTQEAIRNLAKIMGYKGVK